MYMNLTNRMLKERRQKEYGMISFIKSSKPGKNQIILLRNPNSDGKIIKKIKNQESDYFSSQDSYLYREQYQKCWPYSIS